MQIQGPTEANGAAAGPQDYLTAGDIFIDAALFPKLIMIALLAAAVAAIVVCVRKLMSGPKLAGGSAFLSSLRLGGPLLGLLGAAYTTVNIFIAVANVPFVATFKVVAPGLVEALFMVAVGLLAGMVAVVAHWAVEARIDRQVLKS